MGPEGEPGHGAQRQLGREAEDDGAVAVAAQRGEAAVLVRDPGHTHSDNCWLVVLQKVPSEFYPKVCNHGEGPY